MFDSEVLDVVIGLVFIYLLYSLLGTILQEIIATSILGLRGRVLKQIIGQMLDDGSGKKEFTKVFYSHPGIKYLTENILFGKRPTYISKETFSKVLIDLLRGDAVKAGESFRPTIEQTLKDGKITWTATISQNNINTKWGLKNKVDEIFQFLVGHNKKTVGAEEEEEVFRLIRRILADPKSDKKEFIKELDDKYDHLIDLLNKSKPDSTEKNLNQAGTSNCETGHRGNIIPEETAKYLNSIWVDAQGDVTKFREYLEIWYVEMMEKCTGLYKKWNQFMLLVIGLFIAIFFNIDTITIATKLQNSPALRAKIISQINDFNVAKERVSGSAKVKIESTIDKIATEELGTDIPRINHVLGLGWETSKFWEEFCKCDPIRFLGWILTALAISFGAPFWFDLLNKLMKFRGAIAPKDDSSDPEKKKIKTIKTVG
ncbi:hypothetical protein [Dyadobacter pollutisoli]|uniref:Uncharacterized protein n=1 Tax=Dyadobacter pollutisoli TaxID=2910158 RepID=A0A9E8NCF1_9BACT|nr:hypothetical protein [Dyadobacter pollutisoli]WAC12442.1 hypothetical protein ON006_00480 [Dyadobacter pollutisoli]